MTAQSTDIKFACPQCGQSISVDVCGAGLEVRCPTCQQLLIIPSPGALGERSSYGQSIHPSGRETFAAEEAATLRAELQNLRNELAAARCGSEESARALAAAAKEHTRLHQQLKKARDEAGQHAATAAQVPALEAERRQLQSDLTHGEQGMAAAESQLVESRAVIGKLGAQVAALEKSHAQREQVLAQTSEQANAFEKQLAVQTEELNRALTAARQAIDTRTAERAAWQQQLESAQAAAHAVAGDSAEKLAAAHRQLQAAEVEHLALTERHAALRVAADTLRKDLSEIHTGRELIILRERFNTLETDHLRMTAEHARSSEELKEVAASAQKLCSEVAEARACQAEAERRAEAASESALNHDNEVLRGIIERQNVVGEERFTELRRLRRAHLGLRILYAFIALGVVGLIALGIQYLPDAVQHFLHDWFGS